MPEMKSLTLDEAAAVMANAPASRLDAKGFRNDDDLEFAPPASVDDDEIGSDESPTPDPDDLVDDDEINEDDENDSEEPEAAPAIIEPPKSFTADEQAEFRKLPPRVQETLVRRESERDKAFLNKLNTVDAEKKAIEPLAQRLQQEQQNYLQATQAILQMGIPEAQEFQNIDWVHLSRTDAASYVEKKARFEDLQGRIATMVNQANQVQQQQQTQVVHQLQDYLSNQRAKLIENLPDFNDNGKAQTIVKDINDLMTRHGFAPEELSAQNDLRLYAIFNDARIVKLLHHAAQLEKTEQARKSALSKKSTMPAPRVMTPNSGESRGENKNMQRKSALDRLDRSGDIWDAVRLMNM